VNAARAEYVARINRVMDHIERHLDARLSLDELAAVAGFSPFHFHRVFAAMVG
jgi:AraC family transcriptional regulator